VFTFDTPEIRGMDTWVFRAGLQNPPPATIKLVNERKIRIVAVDHNPLLLEGISLLMGLHDEMELVCSTRSGSEAVECFAQHRPDVTLMDLDLPSAAGISAIGDILKLDPAACIIGLLTYEWDPLFKKALRAGARACLTKDRLNDELIPLIHQEEARRRS
jgi:two-component system, NarL family, response regulator